LTPSLVAVLTLAAVVAGEAYFICVLLNKLMSRNYHEYQVAHSVPAAYAQEPAPIKFDNDPVEDLNHIGGPF